LSVDRIFLDGSDAYQPPVPGTVGATESGTAKAGVPGAGGRIARLTAEPPVAGARLAGLAWRAAAGAREASEGEVLKTQVTIIGRRFDDDLTQAVGVDQHVALTDADGALIDEAVTSWSAPRAELPEPDQSTDAITSVEWGALLTQRLTQDPAFASSTATFDGSVGLMSRGGDGTTGVEFRLYRGAILETGRKTLDGPTFAIEADTLTWTELVTGRYDNYLRLAAQGRFTVRGSGFQYLRLTKTVRIMIWHARTMRQEARHG
jgi:hypothetical protein